MSRCITSAGEQFGTVVRTRRAGDFLVRLSDYRGGLCMPAHHHPLAYFSFVVRGRLEERRGRARRDFGPGSVHFHGPHDPHEGRVGPEGLSCLSIIPEGELSRQAAAARPEAPATLPALAARCYRAFRDDDETSMLCLEAAALELLAALLRPPRRDGRARTPAWVGEVREHLSRHHTRGVSLAEMAAVAGVHRVHLVRAFRLHVGLTPGAFQRRLRLEHARRALEASSRPVADIALESGFASQSHLTRLFHREWGLPPEAYRREHRRRRAS